VRRIAVAATLCVLLGGCATAGDGQEVHRLRAWTFPREPFIPRVPASAPKPKAKAKAKAVKVPAKAAPRPASSAGSDISPGAPSDAEIRAQLRELYGGAAGSDPASARTVALSGGLAAAPPDAPAKVQAIVSAANQVARLPYVYGGGHGADKGEGIWVDNAYDCSGSVSFALANAGLLDSPMDSSSLARWGRPGRGRWVTIYANAGHAFMEVGGARFDTVGLKQSGSRWQPAYRSISGFTVRHPPGL
jgi:cell wall-associated NlpC family hydrolase